MTMFYKLYFLKDFEKYKSMPTDLQWFNLSSALIGVFAISPSWEQGCTEKKGEGQKCASTQDRPPFIVRQLNLRDLKP